MVTRNLVISLDSRSEIYKPRELYTVNEKRQGSCNGGRIPRVPRAFRVIVIAIGCASVFIDWRISADTPDIAEIIPRTPKVKYPVDIGYLISNTGVAVKSSQPYCGNIIGIRAPVPGLTNMTFPEV